MKKLLLVFVSLFLCVSILCACQPQPSETATKAVGTVTGLIDNRTVEIILEDGTVQSFLFFDDEVAERLNIAEESSKPVSFSYEAKEGQKLNVIVAIETVAEDAE